MTNLRKGITDGPGATQPVDICALAGKLSVYTCKRDKSACSRQLTRACNDAKVLALLVGHGSFACDIKYSIAIVDGCFTLTIVRVKLPFAIFIKDFNSQVNQLYPSSEVSHLIFLRLELFPSPFSSGFILYTFFDVFSFCLL